MQISAKQAATICDVSSVRAASNNFKRLIYSGTAPTTADSAINGTLLATLGSSSATAPVLETLAKWTITITVGGTAVVAMDTPAITLTPAAGIAITADAAGATLLAKSISNNISFPADFIATASGTTVTIVAPVGSGVFYNSAKVTMSGATGTYGGALGVPSVAGVAASNCCGYDVASVGGVLTSTQTWQTLAAGATTSGTAAWFRDIYEAADDGSDQTATKLYRRRQGTITSIGGGGDLELSTTTIVAATPISVTTNTYTVVQ